MLVALAAIEAAIRGASFSSGTEAELQDGLARVLEQQGAVREVQLGPEDRIDFMVGPVGVEVKTKGGISPLTRQLLRYSQHDRVGALVLVTTRESYRLQLPRDLNGKPLHVISLMGAFA